MVTNLKEFMKIPRTALLIIAIFLTLDAPSFAFTAGELTSYQDAQNLVTSGAYAVGGNVGVGTTGPRVKFEVDGIVYGTNIGVNSTGPRALLEVGTAASLTAGSNAAAIIKNDLVVDGMIYGNGSHLTGVSGALSGLNSTRVPVANSSSTIIDSMIYNVGNNVGIGTTAPVQQLDLTKSISLVNSTNSTTGVIYKGGYPFLHDYAPAGAAGNLFLGKNAGNFTLTGGGGPLSSDNIGVGDSVLNVLTTGYGNVAVGNAALVVNTDGAYNVALGLYALNANQSGWNSVAIGAGALNMDTASDNTAVGADAAGENTSGGWNTALGRWAMQFNKTGGGNLAVGYQAGQGVSNASDIIDNVFLGALAGKAVLTGANQNLMAGVSAGVNVTTGAGNILLGFQAGDAITTGSNNIILGYDIDAQSNTGSNQLSIGNLIFATGGFGTGTTIGTGSVGIATTVPRGTLEVDGTTYLMSGNVGISSTGPRAKLEVGTAASVTAGSNAAAIIKNDLVVDGMIYGDGTYLTNVGAGGGGSGITGLTTGYLSKASTSSTIGNSAIFQDGSGNIGIGTTTPVAGLQIMSGSFLSGSTMTSAGAVVHNYTGVDANAWFGIYSDSNGLYYGIAAQLPAPGGTSVLGGYYRGLGIGGSTTNSSNPIFGVLNSSQSGNGLGNVAFTVYDDNRIVTFNNILDDGSGAVYLKGTVGIGTTAPGSALQVNNTITFQSEYNIGSQAAGFTVNWNNGNKQKVTLKGGAAQGAVTFTAPSSGVTNLLLEVIQGGGGGNTVSWPGAVKWPSASVPALTTTSGRVDIVTCFYNGTDYYCTAALNFTP